MTISNQFPWLEAFVNLLQFQYTLCTDIKQVSIGSGNGLSMKNPQSIT